MLALADDFNTPRALAALFRWIREANRSDEPVGNDDLREMLRVLALDNLLDEEREPVPPEVLELSDRRERARETRDYGEADRLRRQLVELGWEVRDGPEGPELLPVP